MSLSSTAGETSGGNSINGGGHRGCSDSPVIHLASWSIYLESYHWEIDQSEVSIIITDLTNQRLVITTIYLESYLWTDSGVTVCQHQHDHSYLCVETCLAENTSYETFCSWQPTNEDFFVESTFSEQSLAGINELSPTLLTFFSSKCPPLVSEESNISSKEVVGVMMVIWYSPLITTRREVWMKLISVQASPALSLLRF